MKTATITAGMLVSEIRRTLGFKRKGPARVAGWTQRIMRGVMTLNDLINLAKDINCSLPHLVSGCRADYDGELTPSEAVEASIRHAGWMMEDAAAVAGYMDHRYFLKCLRNGTIPIRALLNIASKIGVQMEELFSDSECGMKRWEDCVPDDVEYTREMVRMGWK